MKTQAIITAAITSCFTLLACGAYAQGSLTPPGAPAETMKTLEQVEPRIDAMTVAGNINSEIVISTPGSYYLSANLAVSKTYGIHITATDVVLDLNGFNISRVSGSGGYGVYVGADRSTVRNGTMVGFNYGVVSYSDGDLFEKIAATGCANYGIRAGTSARVVDCRAHDNPGGGIYASIASSLEGCTAYNNQGHGIYSSTGSSLSGCTARSNQGLYGIYALSGSSLVGCTASDNEGDGIYANSGSSLIGCAAFGNEGDGIHASSDGVLRDCSARNNQGYGIYAFSGASLRGCVASGNHGTAGIYANQGSTLSGCTARNNRGSYGIYAFSGSNLNGCTAFGNTGTASSSYGIYAAAGSMISGCSAYLNTHTNAPGNPSQGAGIGVGASGTVRDCNATLNEGDGIRLINDSVAVGNTCDSNGNGGDGAGIRSSAADNRIENNTVTDNDRGIDVDSSGSLIVRNTASGNTIDYDIAGGNDVGTIQTSMPAVGGPWDNFEF